MSKSNSTNLSLFAAIIININIMLGAGIFINTAILAKQAGSLASAVYGLVGILLLPLILAIAKLMRYHKGESTFYHFGKSISPFFGFLSSWSYFIAKLASCGLGIHVCMAFFQKIFPLLATFNTLTLDSLTVLFFIFLNLINLRTGQAIHFTFIILKLVPTLFAILTGAYLFSGEYFTKASFLFKGIPSSVPLVLYAFTGFEASCSLSQSIRNPEKNGPKAIFISYAIVVSLVMLFQFFFFGSLGMTLGKLPNGYLGAFPLLLTKLFGASYNKIKNILEVIMHIGIASSSLGSSYAIMYSNNWNLYTLAQANHVVAKKTLTSLNKFSVPYAGIFVQAFFVLTFLFITGGFQVPLQQVGALGAAIAYTFSTLALWFITYKETKTFQMLPILSLASCGLLLSSFVWSVVTNGLSFLLFGYLVLLSLGSLMFFYKHKTHNKLEIYEHI